MASIACPTCGGTIWEIGNYIQYARLYAIDTAEEKNAEAEEAEEADEAEDEESDGPEVGDFLETNDGELDEVENWEIHCRRCETPAPAELRADLADLVWK
jgi:uncharacterized Zn finger protein (UPF0148 family)